MTHKKIETNGETILVSNIVAKKFDPVSLTGGPREYGEVKTGFNAKLKGHALQRYEMLNESSTQFFCDIIFGGSEKKIIESVLHSFRWEKSSKVVGVFLELHNALKISELLLKKDPEVEIKNVLIKTAQEEYDFESLQTIKHFEIRDIINGTVLVMISFD